MRLLLKIFSSVIIIITIVIKGYSLGLKLNSRTREFGLRNIVFGNSTIGSSVIEVKVITAIIEETNGISDGEGNLSRISKVGAKYITKG